MITVLIDSGFLNATLWAALLVLGLSLWVRGRQSGAIPDPSRSLVFVVALGIGSGAYAAFGLYKGHVLPLDIMQDIVSAQEFLAGRSLYPAQEKMSAQIQATLDNEPEPLSLSHWWPALREKEIAAREEARQLPWVQAHPPFMSLFFVPFVKCFGVTGTYFAISLLSLGALLVTLVLLRRGLDITLSPWQQAALFLVVLGWAPIVGVLRTGQLGLLLCALIVGAWYCLRCRRPILAGMAIGLATCLKLYPGLLLVYLLFRQHRAFVSAVGTIVVLLGYTGMAVGWDVFREHFVTAQQVVTDYAWYPNNLSLLGVLVRSIGTSAEQLEIARGIFVGVGLLIVGGLGWALLRGKTGQSSSSLQLDVEYSLVIALIPLLSPITWDHYLVILLLPLAVLGRQVLQRRSGYLTGFMSLIVLLAIPDTTFTWLSQSLGSLWANVLLQLMRPVVLAVLCLWLIRLIRAEDQSKVASSSDELGPSDARAKSCSSVSAGVPS
jgi:hypothetical protein